MTKLPHERKAALARVLKTVGGRVVSKQAPGRQTHTTLKVNKSEREERKRDRCEDE